MIMSDQKRKAPWPDYAGKPIYEGDTIQHPADGMHGKVFVLECETENDNRWRVQWGQHDPL